MHLVGFIIRIYHDARSPERQIEQVTFVNISVSRHAVNVIVFTLVRKVYHSLTQIFTKRIFQSSVADFSCNGNLI